MDTLSVAMYTAAIAEAMLLARLLWLGYCTRKHYAWFVALLAADLIQTGFVLFVRFPTTSLRYWWLWALTEPGILLLQVLAAREVSIRIRASYPEIGKLGQNIIEWAVLAAVLITVGSLFVDARHVNWYWPVGPATLLIRRGLITVVAIVVGVLAYCTRIAPDAAAPNVRRHAAILAGYLGVLSVSALANRVFSHRLHLVAVLMMSAAVLCFGVWIWAFRRGEDEPPPPEGTATQEELDATLRDLHSLVNGIGRVASRFFGGSIRLLREQVQGKGTQVIENGS